MKNQLQIAIYSLLLTLSLVSQVNTAQAQESEDKYTPAVYGPQQPQGNSNMMTWAGTVIVDGDTLPHWYLKEFVKYADYLDKDKSAQMARLRRNVRLVYPYAVEAAQIINEIDIELKKAGNKKDKKRYLNTLEQQLNAKFKDNLKNLSPTQGAILVKLINRQSGKDVYSVIKELKGAIAARVSQTAFYFYDNNLKTQYDPYNKDKDIEGIVRELEEQAYYNYQVQNTKLIKMNQVQKK